MKKIFSVFFGLYLLLLASTSFCQDTLLTYTRVVTFDSIGKNEIFDKTLIWCSKSFTDSKSAINVKERDGGILAGKALYKSPYKIPKKKDSTEGIYYNNYYFDWLIEIKDNKLRFSVTNVKLHELEQEYVVSSSSKPPYDIIFYSTKNITNSWILTRKYFISNLSRLLDNLSSEIQERKAGW